ncbi:hypothetical protein [Leifsonia sp. 21MFCrub1.1]|uniref:hypothetical protein n=1 Tax=Leifsonia sp. 21MFCrub1.1 TaxID=1798223 RepID=UPI0008928D47|nr:hypothetical protein [Leifsonia sp. 21MFCrub1.1]SEA55344.1 hypothetical protein SAMN04515680_0713 [Leifsonia sp. 21MFCrub1.1]
MKNSNRLWIIGSVLITVVVLVLGWIVGVQPQLAAAATATVQRIDVEQTNARYEAVLAKLKSEHDRLPELTARLAALAASVPSGTESSTFVTELNGVAAGTGVTIRSLTFSDAVSYKPPVAPAEPTPTASGSTATPAPTPSPSASPAAPAPVTSPLITSTNFFATPVQVGVRGSLSQVLDFLAGAQKGERLFLVTALSSSPSTDEGVPEGTVDATIGGYIYAVTPAGATAQGGTGTTSGSTAEASK